MAPHSVSPPSETVSFTKAKSESSVLSSVKVEEAGITPSSLSVDSGISPLSEPIQSADSIQVETGQKISSVGTQISPDSKPKGVELVAPLRFVESDAVPISTDLEVDASTTSEVGGTLGSFQLQPAELRNSSELELVEDGTPVSSDAAKPDLLRTSESAQAGGLQPGSNSGKEHEESLTIQVDIATEALDHTKLASPSNIFKGTDIKISYSSKLQADVQPTSKPRAPLRTIFPAFEIEDHPIDETPSIKAIVVGAGISGINTGILLPIKVPGIELVIYEKASDIVSCVTLNLFQTSYML